VFFAGELASLQSGGALAVVWMWAGLGAQAVSGVVANNQGLWGFCLQVLVSFSIYLLMVSCTTQLMGPAMARRDDVNASMLRGDDVGGY